MLTFKKTLVGALFLAVACSEPGVSRLASRPDSPEWTAIKARIRETFPSVREISTEELARQMAGEQNASDPSGEGVPLLFDARSEAEFAVSHLLGARRFEPSLLADLPKDAEIVVYCSVGYRSAELAENFAGLGYTKVSNLMGSVFQWANEGRPVYSATGPVHKVHPFDAEWGRLLQSSYH